MKALAKTRRQILSAAALLALVCPAASWAGLVERVFEQRYALEPGATLELANINGSLRVETWERNFAELRAVKRAQRDPAELDLVQIVVHYAPHGLSIRTRYPEDSSLDVSVEYHLRVPARLSRVRLETVNGSVRAQGLEGAGELRTVNGNVELYDGAGRFSARSTNGNLRIELRRLDPGALAALETVNGSVVLALPTGAGADLEVDTRNGDFHSELPLLVRQVDSGPGLRAQLGEGGSPLQIRTVNGGIRVVTARPSV